ncbi:MAG: hypothetical protein WD424_02085 [Paenibacillaceae bacterium]
MLNKLMDPSHVLCKRDILWVLDYIKQKVAEEDPGLLSLHQPRLLQNFHYFAEVAMLMLHKRYQHGHEQEQIKSLLREACYGLMNMENSSAQKA